MSAGDEAGSPLDRNFLLCLIFIGLIILGRRRVDWTSFKRSNAWLVALLLFALISVLWADNSFVSFKRYVRLVGSVLMGLIIFSEPNPNQVLESVFKRTVYVLIPFSLLLIKYFPGLGVSYGVWSGERMWVGVTIHKNCLGILCLISEFLLIWAFLRARSLRRSRFVFRKSYPDIIIFLMGLFLMAGNGVSYSATCISALGFSTMALIMLVWMKTLQRRFGAFVLLIPVALVFLYGFAIPFIGASAMKHLFDVLGRDTTLTGRTEIWAEVIPLALDRPVLGYGYGGFWVDRTVLGVKEAHSGYVETMLQLGIIGVLLLLAFCLSFCRETNKSLARDFWSASFGYCLLLMLVLHNVSEASFLVSSDFLWATIIFTKIQMGFRSSSQLVRRGIRMATQKAFLPSLRLSEPSGQT